MDIIMDMVSMLVQCLFRIILSPDHKAGVDYSTAVSPAYFLYELYIERLQFQVSLECLYLRAYNGS